MGKSKRRSLGLLPVALLIGVVLGIAATGWADYPSKPIQMLCAFRAGGGTDSMARLLAKSLGNILGQNVVVINREGGVGGVVAMAVKNSKPDGYTLGITTSPTFSFMPNYTKVEYSIDDFKFLGAIGMFQPCIIAKADKPWKNIKDLIAYSKTHPGLKCVVQMEIDKLFLKYLAKKEGGITWATLPVKGGPGMVSAILGGHADFSFSYGTHYTYVKAGQMKLLAACSLERLETFPEVPTLKEQGYNFSMDIYNVIAAPKMVPKDVINKLSNAISKSNKDPEYRAFLTEKLHFPALDWGPERVTKAIEMDSTQYKDLLKIIR